MIIQPDSSQEVTLYNRNDYVQRDHDFDNFSVSYKTIVLGVFDVPVVNTTIGEYTFTWDLVLNTLIITTTNEKNNLQTAECVYNLLLSKGTNTVAFLVESAPQPTDTKSIQYDIVVIGDIANVLGVSWGVELWGGKAVPTIDPNAIGMAQVCIVEETVNLTATASSNYPSYGGSASVNYSSSMGAISGGAFSPSASYPSGSKTSGYQSGSNASADYSVSISSVRKYTLSGADATLDGTCLYRVGHYSFNKTSPDVPQGSISKSGSGGTVVYRKSACGTSITAYSTNSSGSKALSSNGIVECTVAFFSSAQAKSDQLGFYGYSRFEYLSKKTFNRIEKWVYGGTGTTNHAFQILRWEDTGTTKGITEEEAVSTPDVKKCSYYSSVKNDMSYTVNSDVATNSTLEKTTNTTRFAYFKYTDASCYAVYTGEGTSGGTGVGCTVSGTVATVDTSIIPDTSKCVCEVIYSTSETQDYYGRGHLFPSGNTIAYYLIGTPSSDGTMTKRPFQKDSVVIIQNYDNLGNLIP